jgi:DNA-binding beta-propeller fold protein YncE
MAVNTETNLVYIVRMTSLATDEVTFLNGNDNTWYTIATESFQPTALAVNAKTDTLYVAHYGTGDVRVISAAYSGNAHPATVSIPAWSHPFAIAANTATNKVYVDHRGLARPDRQSSTARRNTAQWPTIATGHATGPKALAVNP